MISYESIWANISQYKALEIKDRFLKHEELLEIIEDLKIDSRFIVRQEGNSFEGRSIHSIQYGKGDTRIFLWSQMHGNEATATMAMIDLFNTLRSPTFELAEQLYRDCTLYFIPMVNPDGAQVFDRRNAMYIDINRDFNHQQTPEGRILRKFRDQIRPAFGFNLHDQSTKWSAGDTGNPASLSLLAPAYDVAKNVNETRLKAMQVIAYMNKHLQKQIPGHVGRFDDEYEPRAFGDNFQAAGTSTILIEAGGLKDDPEKQRLREYYFMAMVLGIGSIASKMYEQENELDYYSIPENRLNHFQIVLRNVKMNKNGQNYRADVGIHTDETPSPNHRSVTTKYVLGDIGDLSNRFAYDDLDCSNYTLVSTAPFKIDEALHLILLEDHNVLIAIENGILTTKNI